MLVVDLDEMSSSSEISISEDEILPIPDPNVDFMIAILMGNLDDTRQIYYQSSQDITQDTITQDTINRGFHMAANTNYNDVNININLLQFFFDEVGLRNISTVNSAIDASLPPIRSYIVRQILLRTTYLNL